MEEIQIMSPLIVNYCLADWIFDLRLEKRKALLKAKWIEFSDI